MTSLSHEEEVEIGLSVKERQVLREMENRLDAVSDVPEKRKLTLAVHKEQRCGGESNMALLLKSQRCCDILRLSLLNYLVKAGANTVEGANLSPLFRQVILDDEDAVVLSTSQIEALQFELSNLLKDKLLKHQQVKTRKSLPKRRSLTVAKSPNPVAHRRRSVVPRSRRERGLARKEKSSNAVALREHFNRTVQFDQDGSYTLRGQRSDKAHIVSSQGLQATAKVKRRKPRKSRKLKRLVERLSVDTVSSKAKAHPRPRSN